jgi:protein O-GlcNAc transferase
MIADEAPRSREIPPSSVAVVDALPAPAMLAQLVQTGMQHHLAGRVIEAEATYRQVLRHDPRHARALHLLGITAHQVGKYGIAAAFISKALASSPDDPALLRNLGNALHEQGKLQEAVTQYERALVIRPAFAAANNDLANTLLAQGFPRKAVARYRQALRIKPDAAATHSNLLFAMQYSGTYSKATLLREAKRWAARHANPLGVNTPAFTNSPIADRRLRIGFVSADLRRHSVAYLLAPALAALDRREFEVTCYSNDWRADTQTAHLQSLSDRWRTIVGLSDDAVVALIRDDGIDILIDLSGHTSGHRLLVFARRPAPVSMTWIGYSGTTGMRAIDSVIVDPIICPDNDTGTFTERATRLPQTYICYQPLEHAPPVATDHLGNDALMFGCFNNLAKVTPDVVETWAAILRRVPNATIFLKTASLDDEATNERYRQLFRSHGVHDAQLRFQGKTKQTAVLDLYNDVHIALDPFPYNGTVTSLEALWMGVPFVTMRGDRFVGRVGETLLSAVGLSDLVADSRAAYIEKAVALAHDRARLLDLRRDLRQRMTVGPLGDHQQFARHLGAAWRQAWSRWCDAQSTESSVKRQTNKQPVGRAMS